MKGIKKLIRKPIVIIFSVIIALCAFSLFVVFALIVPTLDTYSQVAEENSENEAHLDLLTRNVNSFRNLEGSEVSKYLEIVRRLVPEEMDVLRVVILNELVAKNSGLKISNITFEKSTPARQTPTTTPKTGNTPAVQSSRGIFGQVFAQDKPTPVPTSTIKTYSFKVSLVGSYANIEKYVRNIKKTGRLLGLTDVSVNPSEGSDLIAIFSMDLAIGNGSPKVRPEDSITLTAADKKFLEELDAEVEYFVNPTTEKVGKSNPFK